MPGNNRGTRRPAATRRAALAGWLRTHRDSLIVSLLVTLVGGITAGLVVEYLKPDDRPPAPGRTGPPVLQSINTRVETRPAVFAKGQPDWDPFFYFVPAGVDALTAPPAACRERRPWAWGLSGSDADETWFNLTLEGNRDGEISFSNMRIELVKDEPRKPGVVAACPVGGASADPLGLIVDLDARPPTIHFVAEPGGEERPVPRFELKAGEQDSFDVHAYGYAARHYEWRIVADVVTGGTSRPVTIQDGTQPFRTVGTAGCRCTGGRAEAGSRTSRDPVRRSAAGRCRSRR